MAVFTVQPQAGSVELSVAYLTETTRADDGTEQRIMYREIPARRLKFLARTLDLHRTGWLDALVYGGHGEVLTVPYWPHASKLTSQATAGTNVVLSVDTIDREFMINQYVVVWQDERTAEECQITAITPTTITVATLANTWAAGSIVLPAWRGTYEGSADSAKLAATAAEIQVNFLLVTDQDDPGVAEMTDPEVFDIVPVNRVEVSHRYEAMIARQESPFYEHTDYRKRTYPVGGRPYVLWLEEKAAVADMMSWFHSVRGSLRPFWMPTYQHDFEVLSGFGTNTIIVSQMGYTQRLFGARERRFLGFFSPDGTVTKLEVASVVDNGTTETLVLTGSTPSDTVFVSYLLFCRLATDELTISWSNSEIAECELRVIELPGEIIPPGIAPGLGSAIFEGLAPTVQTAVPGVSVAPGVGQAFFEGFTPVVSTSAPEPGVGEATFEGFAPFVFVGLNLAPGVGAGIWTGQAPLMMLRPGTGNATFTGYRVRVKTN